MAESKRRALGEDAIYFDHRGACRDALKHRRCPGRWLGVVSLGRDADGKRIRTKVYGRTKTDVKDKLKQLRASACLCTDLNGHLSSGDTRARANSRH